MAKNKIKTHKATAKRFKLTGTGKVKRSFKQNRNNSHLVNKRKSARKIIAKDLVISGNWAKRIKTLLNK